MSTNKLGNTNVYGTFNNSNYSSSLKTAIASANFDGNVVVKGNLTLGTETAKTNLKKPKT
jgi:hypothetical protein